MPPWGHGEGSRPFHGLGVENDVEGRTVRKSAESGLRPWGTRRLLLPPLAEKAGLHRVEIARLETASRGPSWETVLAICTALGVSCEQFRIAAAGAAKKGPGRPRKPASDAAEATVEEQAGDATQANQGPAKKTRKPKSK